MGSPSPFGDKRLASPSSNPISAEPRGSGPSTGRSRADACHLRFDCDPDRCRLLGALPFDAGGRRRGTAQIATGKPARRLRDAANRLGARAYRHHHQPDCAGAVAAGGARRNQSERFQFEADPGSQFFVSYALPKVPVTDALTLAVHVRANRVGVQLYGRVVLPEDVDPETRAPSFLLIQGTDLRACGPLAAAGIDPACCRRSSARPGSCGPRRGGR